MGAPARAAAGPDVTWALVRALPRRLASRSLGVLGRARVPRALLRPVLRLYASAFGVAADEADRSLGDYGSFLDFFVRRLRPGLRPLDPDPRAVVAPADARVRAFAEIRQGRAVAVKGYDADLALLLGSSEDARACEGGTALAFHLAPGDYHRFHWPLDGTVHRVRHLPGDLWPVHPGAASRMPGLLARNERVACMGTTAAGAAFAFVAVGALNVGSIRLAFLPALRTNRGAAGRTLRVDATGRRGDEFGWFEFGSALVLALAPSAGRLDALASGTRTRVGQRIGALTGAR